MVATSSRGIQWEFLVWKPSARQSLTPGERLELHGGTAAIDQVRGELPAFRDRLHLAGDEQRRACVEQHRIALRPALVAREYPAHDGGVRFLVAPGEVGQRRGLQRVILGRQARRSEAAIMVKLGDRGFAQCGKFIQMRGRRLAGNRNLSGNPASSTIAMPPVLPWKSWK